jgi:hypothetical protein
MYNCKGGCKTFGEEHGERKGISMDLGDQKEWYNFRLLGPSDDEKRV